jgi:hypothetical protein
LQTFVPIYLIANARTPDEVFLASGIVSIQDPLEGQVCPASPIPEPLVCIEVDIAESSESLKSLP